MKIYPNWHGRGDDRRAYTDHFRVVAWLRVEPGDDAVEACLHILGLHST
jgi:hypothetical protein